MLQPGLEWAWLSRDGGEASGQGREIAQRKSATETDGGEDAL
jgi:hypothetical protein